MKVNIVENKERKTVTVIIGEVRFFSAKFLLERFEDTRYFGSGIIKTTPDEMNKLLKDISSSLNLVNPEVKISPKLLFESDDVEYPIFKKYLNQNGEWDGNTFEIKLGALSEKRERHLFFEDLARTKPVTNEDVIREHEWALEVEFSTKIDDESLETKIYLILHRIIKGKKTDTKYQTNDSAWGGFDFGVDEEENNNDDIPF